MTNIKNVEMKTIEVMIKLYCKRHRKKPLCKDCSDLLTHAKSRLNACPHKKKPICSKCKIHCYEKSKREQIKIVMKEIGPTFIFLHPFLALVHFFKRVLGT